MACTTAALGKCECIVGTVDTGTLKALADAYIEELGKASVAAGIAASSCLLDAITAGELDALPF